VGVTHPGGIAWLLYIPAGGSRRALASGDLSAGVALLSLWLGVWHWRDWHWADQHLPQGSGS